MSGEALARVAAAALPRPASANTPPARPLPHSSPAGRCWRPPVAAGPRRPGRRSHPVAAAHRAQPAQAELPGEHQTHDQAEREREHELAQGERIHVRKNVPARHVDLDKRQRKQLGKRRMRQLGPHRLVRDEPAQAEIVERPPRQITVERHRQDQRQQHHADDDRNLAPDAVGRSRAHRIMLRSASCPARWRRWSCPRRTP